MAGMFEDIVKPTVREASSDGGYYSIEQRVADALKETPEQFQARTKAETKKQKTEVSPTWEVVKAQFGRQGEKLANLGLSVAGSVLSPVLYDPDLPYRMITPPSETAYPITPNMMADANKVVTTITGMVATLAPLAIPVAGAGVFVGTEGMDKALEIGEYSGYDEKKMQQALAWNATTNTAMLALAPLSKTGYESIKASGLLTQTAGKEIGKALAANLAVGVGGRLGEREILKSINPELAKKVDVLGVENIAFDVGFTLFAAGLGYAKYKGVLKDAGVPEAHIDSVLQMTEERINANPVMKDAIDTLNHHADTQGMLARADEEIAALTKLQDDLGVMKPVENVKPVETMKPVEAARVEPVEQVKAVEHVEIDTVPVKIKTIDEAGKVAEVEMPYREAVNKYEAEGKRLTDILNCVTGG